MDLEEIYQVKEKADCLWSADQLTDVYDRLAANIDQDHKDSNLLVLCVMNGGLFLTAELLKRMTILSEQDYIHATRYQGETEGGEMNWIRFPIDKIKNRHILLVDDILDVGITLKEITNACIEAGAASVQSVVLTEKQHDRRIDDIAAKYVGVSIPDRYVFGCGMDYHGYLRDLDGIYAVGEK